MQQLNLTSTMNLRLNWKYHLLVTVVLLGVITMTGFKVSVSGGNAWFIGLVLFTEISAGVSMFAQTMLRQIDTQAANTAFRFSVIARVMMALVGVALFIEHAEITVENGRLVSFIPSRRVSVSAFMTYEISNGLMLLIEFMFSKMISKPEGFERFKALVIRVGLGTDQFDNNNQDVWEEVADFFSSLQAQLARWKSEANTLRQVVQVLTGILETWTPSRNLTDSSGEKHSPMPDDFADLEAKANEMAKYARIGREMVGTLYTHGPNIQGWYCPNCLTHNTKGMRAKAVCQTCNHTLTDE